MSVGLAFYGFVVGEYGTRADLRAGRLTITPDELDESRTRQDYRLLYTSYDGLRSRDASEINDEDFLSFLQSEPQVYKDVT